MPISYPVEAEVVDAQCAIWGTPVSSFQPLGQSTEIRSARAGGWYRISTSVEPTIASLSDAEKAKLSTWIVDEHLKGERVPLITFEVVREIQSRRPLQFSAKRRRFFRALSDLSFSPSDEIANVDLYTPQSKFWLNYLFPRTEEYHDLKPFLALMIDAGYLIRREYTWIYQLTAKGFDEIEKAETKNSESHQGFVAMWFHESMDSAYEHGFAAAINDAGFEPMRIDKKDHTNKIDDEIILEIKRSRFVVADFTCEIFGRGRSSRAIARGGVYFEAGFALGLGIPVFWTCRADCMPGLHFDTRQFAHIVWNEPVDLRDALAKRIQATLSIPRRG